MAKFTYLCLPFRQNADAPYLCIFHAPASEVLRWAAIERLPDRPKAAQRRLNDYKADAIKRFLSDPRNCIPTAVTVALRPGSNALFTQNGRGAWNPKKHGEVAKFTLSVKTDTAEKDMPAAVIDGQHRLYGVKRHSPETHVTVVALIDAPEIEVAFQFLVINNKSSKVSADHIKSLATEYDKENLEERLKTAKLTQFPNLEFVSFADSDPESPFKGLMRWPSNRTGLQIVPPAAIESAITSVQQKEIKLFEDIDAMCAFFFAIWTVIKENWSDAWEESCREEAPAVRKRLLDKIGIVCLTQYFVDALIQLADLDMLDLANPAEVKLKVEEMLVYQAKQLWQVEWVSASYDTKAGRGVVVESLIRISRNLRKKLPWYDEVKLIDPGSIGEAIVDEG
jgi:DGQHR domain-containing protein